MTTDISIKVTAVRHRGRTGGAVIAGQILGGTERRVVVLSHRLLPDSALIQKGQAWRVSGPMEERATTPAPGVRLVEQTITAKTAVLERPTGRNLIDFIASNEDIRGVGRVKATRLFEAFGDGLIELIESRCLEQLETVVSAAAATDICNAFERAQCLTGLHLLDQLGVDPAMGRKVIAYFGKRTPEVIGKNPYVLVPFMGKWKSMDAFALERCGVAPDSPYRLTAALEDALYGTFTAGSTLVAPKELTAQLQNRLGCSVLTKQALMLKSAKGQFYRSSAGFHPAGAWLMERQIALFVRGGDAPPISQRSLDLSDAVDLDSFIDRYEANSGFLLTEEQRNAVKTSATSRISLICGGAGVGKTTVLKCLIQTIEGSDPCAAIHMVAVAGKAALRMTEATGREASTIAGFLSKAKFDTQPANTRNWLLIDEGSMVDLVTLYRLVRLVPESTCIIMIGDPYQLPPVGPGLTLHALIDRVPTSALTLVQRQAARTGIPQAAAVIRSGHWPEMPMLSAGLPVPKSEGVFFMPCGADLIDEMTVSAYQQLICGSAHHGVKVLSTTKAGPGGVAPINSAIQDVYQAASRVVHHVDEDFGVIPFIHSHARIELRQGDLVIFTRNDYERGLRNGSLGLIEEVHTPIDATSPTCTVIFENERVTLSSDDLPNLELAYSITVHKSQGSQFERVIIPVRHSRLLDRSLLYTAITRAVSQVVFIGDIEAARQAVHTVAASRRSVGLPYLLASDSRLSEVSESTV